MKAATRFARPLPSGFACFAATCTLGPAASVQAQTNEVYIRILDVGPGLACIIKLSDNRCMVYNAGHWDTALNGSMAARHAMPTRRETVTTSRSFYGSGKSRLSGIFQMGAGDHTRLRRSKNSD